jgi:hypothetical protein
MAHYAFLSGNTVVEVIVGIDETELIEGLSPEEWYGNFRGQRCIRTSYNGNIRGKYAGIGDYYDEATDTFISPTYPSQTGQGEYELTAQTELEETIQTASE